MLPYPYTHCTQAVHKFGPLNVIVEALELTSVSLRGAQQYPAMSGLRLIAREAPDAAPADNEGGDGGGGEAMPNLYPLEVSFRDLCTIVMLVLQRSGATGDVADGATVEGDEAGTEGDVWPRDDLFRLEAALGRLGPVPSIGGEAWYSPPISRSFDVDEVKLLASFLLSVLEAGRSDEEGAVLLQVKKDLQPQSDDATDGTDETDVPIDRDDDDDDDDGVNDAGDASDAGRGGNRGGDDYVHSDDDFENDEVGEEEQQQQQVVENVEDISVRADDDGIDDNMVGGEANAIAGGGVQEAEAVKAVDATGAKTSDAVEDGAAVDSTGASGDAEANADQPPGEQAGQAVGSGVDAYWAAWTTLTAGDGSYRRGVRATVEGNQALFLLVTLKSICPVEGGGGGGGAGDPAVVAQAIVASKGRTFDSRGLTLDRKALVTWMDRVLGGVGGDVLGRTLPESVHLPPMPPNAAAWTGDEEVRVCAYCGLCVAQVVLYLLCCTGCVVQAVLYRLCCTGYAVQAVRSQMFEECSESNGCYVDVLLWSIVICTMRRVLLM